MQPCDVARICTISIVSTEKEKKAVERVFLLYWVYIWLVHTDEQREFDDERTKFTISFCAAAAPVPSSTIDGDVE